MSTRVLAVRIHPVTGEPGVELDAVAVAAEGLAGDRRKRAAVHLVGVEHGPTTRANLVVTGTAGELDALVGRVIVIGEVELGITRTAGNCAGVYADVLRPGVLAVGGELRALGES